MTGPISRKVIALALAFAFALADLPLPLPFGSLACGGTCLAPPGLGQLGLSWPTPLQLRQIAPPEPLAH